MRGNTFGKLLSMTSFGESHGKAIGVVVDGVPGGPPFDLQQLKNELERRAPGRLPGTTARQEKDEPEVLSGIYDGKTLGTPICVMIRNHNQKSEDYTFVEKDPRPGHADLTTLQKYGARDPRGGGRASGRETIARVVGGYFASLIIPHVKIKAFCTKMGPFQWEGPSLATLNLNTLDHLDPGPYGLPNPEKWADMETFLLKCKQEGNSVGGKVAILVDHAPIGLGEPAFDKLKADLGKALLSIGACTAFSYGLGEEFENYGGKEVSGCRDNFGGMEGGISNGGRMVMNVTFKPPSTVGEKAQQGRHDPCVIPRAIPVVESMVTFVLADHYLRQNAYQIPNKG